MQEEYERKNTELVPFGRNEDTHPTLTKNKKNLTKRKQELFVQKYSQNLKRPTFCSQFLNYIYY